MDEELEGIEPIEETEEIAEPAAAGETGVDRDITEEADTKTPEYIPYQRFKEVNDKLRDLERQLESLQQTNRENVAEPTEEELEFYSTTERKIYEKQKALERENAELKSQMSAVAYMVQMAIAQEAMQEFESACRQLGLANAPAETKDKLLEEAAMFQKAAGGTLTVKEAVRRAAVALNVATSSENKGKLVSAGTANVPESARSTNSKPTTIREALLQVKDELQKK